MAVAYRSSSVRTPDGLESDTSDGTINIPVPAGASAGDVVVAGIGQWSSPWDAVTPPTGFTLAASFENNPVKVSVYWKRLTGSDTGNYAFVKSGGGWWNGFAAALSGVVTSGDPITTYFAAGGAYNATFPNLTISDVPYAPGLVWAAYNESAAPGGNPPTGFTSAVKSSYGRLAYQIPGVSGDQAATGATIGSTMQVVQALVAVAPAEDSGGAEAPVAKVYLNGSWQAVPAKVWNGTAWVEAPVKTQ